MDLKFENPRLNVLCKIALFYKQKLLNKIICFDFLSKLNYTQNCFRGGMLSIQSKFTSDHL